LKEKLLDLNEQKGQLDEEKREVIKSKTKLELNIKDSEDAITEFHSSKVSFVSNFGGNFGSPTAPAATLPFLVQSFTLHYCC
jgi:hypothetical protein